MYVNNDNDDDDDDDDDNNNNNDDDIFDDEKLGRNIRNYSPFSDLKSFFEIFAPQRNEKLKNNIVLPLESLFNWLLQIANGGQLVFLPLSDSLSICWEAKMIISIFNLLFIIQKQNLYDYHFSKCIHF